ncbi:MAG: branched-chain amino acid ABC transporter permease, partial [Burkholderiales bacterium]
MRDFLELAVSAAASGCIYGLVALAYLLMIRPTGIINFAVGEWAMLGAFGGFVLLTKYEWPYALGMAVVVGFMLAVGWATERAAVRPLVERGAPLLAPILALLGMLVVFREIVSVSFPPDPHPVPYPFGIGYLEIGPLGGSYQSFFIIGVTVAVFVAVWLFFERTTAGKSFEAVAIHRRAAALMGINLSRVTALSFAGGAGAAGLAEADPTFDGGVLGQVAELDVLREHRRQRWADRDRRDVAPAARQIRRRQHGRRRV